MPNEIIDEISLQCFQVDILISILTTYSRDLPYFARFRLTEAKGLDNVEEDVISECSRENPTLFAHNQAWFNDVYESFKKHIVAKKPPKDWLLEQLASYQIVEYAPADPYQRCIQSHAFRHGYDYKQLLSPEAGEIKLFDNFIQQIFEKEIAKEELKCGDTLIYFEAGVLKHIATYIGVKDSIHYALSKFGLGASYFHPIDITANYGRPTFYRMKNEIQKPDMRNTAHWNDVLNQKVEERMSSRAKTALRL